MMFLASLLELKISFQLGLPRGSLSVQFLGSLEKLLLQCIALRSTALQPGSIRDYY